MVAHNHLQWGVMPSSGVSEDCNSVLTYIKNKNLFKQICFNYTELRLRLGEQLQIYSSLPAALGSFHFHLE